MKTLLTKSLLLTSDVVYLVGNQLYVGSGRVMVCAEKASEALALASELIFDASHVIKTKAEEL